MQSVVKLIFDSEFLLAEKLYYESGLGGKLKWARLMEAYDMLWMKDNGGLTLEQITERMANVNDSKVIVNAVRILKTLTEKDAQHWADIIDSSKDINGSVTFDPEHKDWVVEAVWIDSRSEEDVCTFCQDILIFG